jgi:hypothetical protein
VLVKVNNILIIWQIKNLTVRAKDGNFKASEIGKAIKQCRGAKRKLKSMNSIMLRNVNGIEKTIEFNDKTEYYLIAAIEGGMQPISDYYDDSAPGNVHIFYEVFTRLAIKYLNTITDFTDYLKAKEAFFATTNVILSGGEENLLAYFLKNARTFGELQESNFVFFDDEDHWSRLENHADFKAKLEADEWSKGWDELIEKRRQAIGVDNKYKSPEKFLATMTQHSRLERRLLGKMFFDAALEAAKQKPGYAYRRYVPCQNVTYVFGFMGDENTPREMKQKMLLAACLVARHRIPMNNMVIGVVTELKMIQSPISSFEWVSFDIDDEEFEKDYAAEAQEYSEKLDMLQKPKVAYTSSKEYPNQESK